MGESIVELLNKKLYSENRFNLDILFEKKEKEIYKIVNEKLSGGETLLHQAVMMDNKKAVQKLVDFGADVNSQDQLLNSPLHYVRSVDVAEILIKNNADINAKNEESRSVLYTIFVSRYMCQDDNIDLIKFLLKVENVDSADLKESLYLPPDSKYEDIVNCIWEIHTEDLAHNYDDSDD